MAVGRPEGPPLRLVQGGGAGRPPEALDSREAVTRVLVGATADLLLRRITPPAARDIRTQVERVLALFDAVDAGAPREATLGPALRTLEAMVRPPRRTG